MAKGKKNSGNSGEDIFDLRHPQSSRLNIPPAGLVARGNIEKEKQIEYDYNPHLPPVLRFDDTGTPDRITELIHASKERKLTDDEVRYLESAFNNHQPWLEWTGKKEQNKCVVDPVALNIHERISAQAIIAATRREDVQRDIFADPDMEYNKAIQFYKHPMGWTNRMILGDSLAVMASLSRREALAGKVQMIYMDPPYGIKFSSNFQTEVYKRDVGDTDDDLTRDVETIKAYRDTWKLGVHSYLGYLRDRIRICFELLSNTGSIFLQISEENLHRVTSILDEIFGTQNRISIIPFRKKTMPLGAKYLDSMNDYIVWYAKDHSQLKYKQLFAAYNPENKSRWLFDEKHGWHRLVSMRAPGFTEDNSYSFAFNGKNWSLSDKFSWIVDQSKMKVLSECNRLRSEGSTLSYILKNTDFPYQKVTNFWVDTSGPMKRRYAVETSEFVIARCMLMSTDPGDLVLDPTCGSGTTAFVAEHWGRRWITVDISRVSLALSKQRLLTSIYPYFKLRPTNAYDIQRNPDGLWLSDPQGTIEGSSTFDCKTASHVTLKSVVQNQALEPIFEKWKPILERKLTTINTLFQSEVGDNLKKVLFEKYQSLTNKDKKADKEDDLFRRLVLPPYLTREYSDLDNDYNGWYPWEVPIEVEETYPDPFKEAIHDYNSALLNRIKEIDTCIQARAEQDELVDQARVDNALTRVSGPFTIEGVIPLERSILDDDKTTNDPNDILDRNDENVESSIESEPQNSEAYLDFVIKLLKSNGIHLNKDMQYVFDNLEKLNDGTSLHATGNWRIEEIDRMVAITIGPQYGAINALIVEESIRLSARRGYDDLVFAAFSFEGTAQAIIQQDQDPNLRVHLAHIAPDVNMGDLLKNTQAKSLFTITGSPRVTVKKDTNSKYIVTMEGVDIYDPITNSVLSTNANKVAAWFLDSDYDGKCFCICQAFFPDKDAWGKISKALKGSVSVEEFVKFSGTESIPFKAGGYKTIAVKVIDPRGNEVMRIERLV